VDRLLLIGGGLLQSPVVEKAKVKNLEVICFDALRDPYVKNWGVRCYQQDISLEDECLALAKSIHDQEPFQGVMTLGTDFSTTVSRIGQELGLATHSYQGALKAKDKYLMRQSLKEAGLRVPFFLEAQSMDQIPQALPYPMVCKPVDSMGARGVVLVQGPGELEKAFFLSLSYSSSGRVILEEYVEGQEYSIDALVWDDQWEIYGIADRKIVLEPYFVELGHRFPCTLSWEESQLLSNEFIRGVKALGLHWGAAKGDIKMTAQGPVILELAARLSGGFMSGWTYPAHSGRDAVEPAIDLALGKIPVIKPPSSHQSVQEGALISPPGLVLSLGNPTDLGQEKGERWIRTSPGERVQFPRNNVEKYGNIFSHSDSPDFFSDFFKKLALEYLVLDTEDRETEHYWNQRHEMKWLLPHEYSYAKVQDFQEAQNFPLRDLFGNPAQDQFQVTIDLLLPGTSLDLELKNLLWQSFCHGGMTLFFWYGRKCKIIP